jgi:penicillin-binding protein 2
MKVSVNSKFLFFLFILLCILFVVIEIRVVRLSLVEGVTYFEQALNNMYSQKYIGADRGLVFDASGELVVDNVSVWQLYLEQAKSSLEIQAIKNDLIFEGAEFAKEFVDYGGYKDGEADTTFSRILVFDQIDSEFGKEILESYKGFVLIQQTNRVVSDPYAFSHVVGYIGSPTVEEMSDKNISSYSKVGKTGLERYYDEYLRGSDGIMLIGKGQDGNILHHSKSKTEAGKSLRLTIESRWQKLLYELLALNVSNTDSIGASVVIVESDTGKVKALVSYPGFDVNSFSKGVDQQVFDSLVQRYDKPLLNRAIQTKFAPGSTFKPIFALSALANDVVGSSFTYNSQGCITLGQNQFCEADRRALGAVDMYQAISRSSNLYFCEVGKLFDAKYGEGQTLRYLLEMSDKFMLEQKTGIDLDFEVAGDVATPEQLYDIEKRVWSIGDLCNTVIGQGFVSQTPMRMALVASVFVNDGLVYKPFIVGTIEDGHGDILLEHVPDIVSDLDIQSDHLEVINTAMRQTVLDLKGSGHVLSSLDMEIYLKTGSSDAEEMLSNGSRIKGAHSWVIGTFVLDNTKYSFALVSQYGGRGYVSLPIIGNFLNCVKEEYLDGCEKRF